VGTNHPGEIAALSRVLQPDWGVVTNVGPGHIGHFGTVEAIAREKSALLASLPSDGLAVVNRDGGHGDLLCEAAACATLTVSMRSDADYRCVARDAARGEALIRERESGEEFTLEGLPPGAYSVSNALLAVAVARRQGVGWHDIGSAVRNFRPGAMRWDVGRLGGVRVINDAYNANPLSARAALEAFLEQPVEGGRWLVLGGMLELGALEEHEHRSLGAWLSERTWAGLVTVGALGSLIGEGAREAGFPEDRVFDCASSASAAAVLAGETAAGDAVLLKASRGIHLEDVLVRLKETRKGAGL